MPTVHKIASNAVILSGGQVLILLSNFISIVLITNYMGVKGFGIFNYSIIFVGYFAIFANLGMKPIIYREFSRNKASRETLFWNALGAKLIINCAIWIFLIATSVIIHRDPKIIETIFFMSFLLFVSAKNETFRIVPELFLESEFDVKRPILFQVMDGLILMTSIYIATRLHAKYILIVMIFVFANLPGILGLFWFINRRHKIKFLVHLDFLKWLVKESYPIFFFSLFMFLHDRTDIMLLKTFAGMRDIGLYAAAFRLVNPLSFFVSAVLISIYPLMALYGKTNKEHFDFIVNLAVKAIFLLGIIFAVSIYFFANDIIIFLFSKKYAASIPALRILVWSKIFGFLILFLVDLNNSIDKQALNTKVAITIFLVNLLLDLFLIPRFSYIGASWGKLFSLFVGSLFIFLIVKERIQSGLIFSMAKILPFIPLFIYARFAFGSYYQLGYLVGMIVFILFVVKISYFSQEERHLLLQIISRKVLK